MKEPRLPLKRLGRGTSRYEPKSLIPNKPMNCIKSITATASVIMANVAHPNTLFG